MCVYFRQQSNPDRSSIPHKNRQVRWFMRSTLYRQMCVLRLALTSVYLFGAIASAEEADWTNIMAEATWDWRAGDLIFRSGIDPLDDHIATATGAEFGSVGILRASSGGPRVVYVDPEQGVTEDMLFDFIAGINPDEYAVYRLEAAGNLEDGGNLMSYYALYRAYGFPADPYYILGSDTYYSAELAYLAAFGAGVQLATPTRLGDLTPNAPELRDAFLAGWRDHPYCQYALTKQECWGVIREVAVVTTGAIMNDANLTRRYPQAEQ